MLSSVTWGSTASYAWDLAAFAEVDGNTHITDADITVAADDAGILWLYARHAKTAAIGAVGEIIVAYTHSDGKNWVRVGLDSKVPASLVQTSQLWSGGVNGAQTDATHYPRHLAACWQRGRAVMVHQWYAATATTTQTSLGVAYIGGYHDLTIAPIRDGTSLTERHPWQLTRLPIERAQDTLSWTLVSSGAFANALQSVGAERFSAPGGAAGGYVYRDYAASGDDLAVLTFAAYASGAGATGTAQRAALSARIDDGARGVEVGIYMGATEFGVYDVVAGTQLGLIQSLSNNAREFRIGVYANEANSVRTSPRVVSGLEQDRRRGGRRGPAVELRGGLRAHRRWRHGRSQPHQIRHLRGGRFGRRPRRVPRPSFRDRRHRRGQLHRRIGLPVA
jgi:hypothetical protein